MALPSRSFSDAQTLIQLLTASKISTTDIGTLYNVAYRQVLESHQWSARKAEAVVNTVDPYTTGTVTATQDSTTVTGSGTTWTSAMTGRYIRINDEDTFFKFTYVSATSGTLEKAWAFDTVSAATYEIFQYVYAADATNGEVGQVLTPGDGWPFSERSFEWISLRDPSRRAVGGLPRIWVPHGVDTNGAFLIEFWPRYESATSIRVPYYKRVDDLSGSSKPVIRGDVVEALATAYCFSHLWAKFGDPHYKGLAEHWEKVFDAALEAAIREDMDRHALPRSVQGEFSSTSDYDFMVRHDV